MGQSRERFTRRPVLRTGDLDEALDGVGQVFLPHRIEVLDPAADLDLRLNGAQLGSVTADLRYGPEVRVVTVDASHHHVDILLAGANQSRSGRRDRVVATPQRSAVFIPEGPARSAGAPGAPTSA
jgi:AraC-binding-like domain